MTGHETHVSQPPAHGLDLYYDTLLDSLADGVLSISPERRIEVLNATGATILGCASGAIIGCSLAEAFLHDEANDAFVDAVLDAVISDNGTVKSVVDFSRAGDARRLAIASTAYEVRSGPHRGQQGVVVTFNDVTETLRLRAAERSLEDSLAAEHAKLRSAYLKLEEAAAREGRVARRTGLIRIGAALAVGVGISAIALSHWGVALPSMTTDVRTGPSAGQTLTVRTQAIVSRVAVVGSVDAGSVVSVVGPFDGAVKEKDFEYGSAVSRGQALVKLDTSQTEVQLREAEGARIKSRQALDVLRNWESNPEMSRARRSLASAEQDLSNLVNKTAQTKLLLGKGIVPADEYNELLQQQSSQKAQLQAAKEDLDTIMERGSEENRRVAEFEMLNAEVKADELRNDLKNATVLAPVSGVVLQPATIEGKQGDLLAVGSRVVRGQTMLAIGDLESYSIRAKVDEIDINKVHVGQPVEVTGDAFDDMTLHGIVVTVAAQAAGDSQTHSGMATFPIVVRISGMTPEQQARVHVGMSASVSIITYDNPAAIVVPPSALAEADGKRIVSIQRDGTVLTVPVLLGISTPDGIEVRQGLKAGDVVKIGG